MPRRQPNPQPRAGSSRQAIQRHEDKDPAPALDPLPPSRTPWLGNDRGARRERSAAPLPYGRLRRRRPACTAAQDPLSSASFRTGTAILATIYGEIAAVLARISARFRRITRVWRCAPPSSGRKFRCTRVDNNPRMVGCRRAPGSPASSRNGWVRCRPARHRSRTESNRKSRYNLA